MPCLKFVLQTEDADDGRCFTQQPDARKADGTGGGVPGGSWVWKLHGDGDGNAPATATVYDAGGATDGPYDVSGDGGLRKQFTVGTQSEFTSTGSGSGTAAKAPRHAGAVWSGRYPEDL